MNWYWASKLTYISPAAEQRQEPGRERDDTGSRARPARPWPAGGCQLLRSPSPHGWCARPAPGAPRQSSSSPGLPVMIRPPVRHPGSGARRRPGSTPGTRSRPRPGGQFRGLHADLPLIRAADADHPAGQPRPRVPVRVLLLSGQRVPDLTQESSGNGPVMTSPRARACAMTRDAVPAPSGVARRRPQMHCAGQLRLMTAAGPRRGTGPGSPRCGTGRTTGRSPPPYTRPPRRPGSPGHDPAARHAPSGLQRAAFPFGQPAPDAISDPVGDGVVQARLADRAPRADPPRGLGRLAPLGKEQTPGQRRGTQPAPASAQQNAPEQPGCGRGGRAVTVRAR